MITHIYIEYFWKNTQDAIATAILERNMKAGETVSWRNLHRLFGGFKFYTTGLFIYF